MTQRQEGLLVDVWIGFHVLFVAVVFSVLLMLFDVFAPSDSIVVAGPIGVAAFAVLGRSSARAVRKLTSA
ncbi:hypothetical protein [Halorussus litoreus]|uniref:hypothetical protein n=1 Tax=Halorussus litoreus TaxID=1710536 RepID=UPI00130057DC|nr:hypothetical protein [Halorussus litoreus]